MARARVLLTITDGEDNASDKERDFPEAVNNLNKKEIYSLSVGIGTIDVDHRGLALLAHLTGGLHVAPLNSEAVACALRDITTFIHTKIAGLMLSDGASHLEQIAVRQRAVRAAIDLLILIDCSWSMGGLREDGTWTGDKNKLKNTKASSINVIDSLDPNHDRVGVAKFWEKYQLLTGLTSNFDHCKRLINGIELDNATGLYRAIGFAAEEF
ncbi:MAG: VWA domain-containing protein [Candidatus Gracilibacteria bacterium]|nr:VWA domain-containing protein [Candidatus Gracilibacteria bacterium]